MINPEKLGGEYDPDAERLIDSVFSIQRRTVKPANTTVTNAIQTRNGFPMVRGGFRNGNDNVEFFSAEMPSQKPISVPPIEILTILYVVGVSKDIIKKILGRRKV